MEPLANDVDPMGGVLSVTSVKAPANTNVKVGLVAKVSGSYCRSLPSVIVVPSL